MLFTWSEDTIRSYVEASEYTGFHRRLAHLALPYLDKEDAVVDIGCGPGLIDFFLAEYVKSVTAVDEVPEVIHYIRRNLDMRGTPNLFPRLSALADLGEETWDVVLLCFFGSTLDELRLARSKARKKMLIFTHGEGTDLSGSMVKPDTKKIFAREVESFLKTDHIYYHMHRAKLDFGQPFRSTSEALRFFRGYSRVEDPEEKKGKIEGFMAKLIETGNKTYPYFYPKYREIAVFICEL